MFGTGIATTTITTPISTGVTTVMQFIGNSITTFWGYAFLIIIAMWLFSKVYGLFRLR